MLLAHPLVFESKSICLIANTFIQSVHHCNFTEREGSPDTLAQVGKLCTENLLLGKIRIKKFNRFIIISHSSSVIYSVYLCFIGSGHELSCNCASGIISYYLIAEECCIM